ncbi:MAG: ParB/RepB/Spo0J family partition protein [Candidatus Omnitrophota bacterium]
MDKRLGKGLGALISESQSEDKKKVDTIKVVDIVPNPFRPRKKFAEKRMEDLINSLKEKGVIQPILVRPAGKLYELIAGERRWRAAQELNMEEIPAIIRDDIDDANSLEISLIENIQREELNPIEEATAYKELIDQFEYTLDKVGQMMGKDKTTISNSIRLLALSEEIRKDIEDGKLSTGHAKALLSVANEYKRKKISNIIIQKGLSVRETEQLVKRIGEPKTQTKKSKNPEMMQIEEELRHKLGTKVNIYQGKKRGKIEIQYFSNEDLQRILSLVL